MNKVKIHIEFLSGSSTEFTTLDLRESMGLTHVIDKSQMVGYPYREIKELHIKFLDSTCLPKTVETAASVSTGTKSA